MKRHCEADRDHFTADAYAVKGAGRVAWYVLGWETEPDEDTEWSGCEQRTGLVLACMVGDDRYVALDEDDLIAIPREDYCGECGQIGCQHDGLER